MGGIIFPANRFSKPPTVAKDSVQKQHQQQPQPKLRSWQDKFKPLASNLSIYSQYFQNALVLAITGVVGILITQWFDIPEGDWVLITIVIILMPAYTDISLTFNKIVHRLIGTTIGAIIAAIIINNIDNQWLLSLFLFLFASIFVSCSMKTKNYAFELISDCHNHHYRCYFRTNYILNTSPSEDREYFHRLFTFVGCCIYYLDCS